KDAWSVAAGNYSSRFAGAVAGTVHLAAKRLKGKMTKVAAHQLGCDQSDIVFEGAKVYSIHQPDKALSFARLASSAHWSPAELPEGMAPGMRVTEFWTPESL